MPAAQTQKKEAARNNTKDKRADVPLPDNWEKVQDANGKAYYVDHSSKKTTWLDPRLKVGSFQLDGDSLPVGWESAKTSDGRDYYIDHNTHSTTFQKPISPKLLRKINLERERFRFILYIALLISIFFLFYTAPEKRIEEWKRFSLTWVQTRVKNAEKEWTWANIQAVCAHHVDLIAQQIHHFEYRKFFNDTLAFALEKWTQLNVEEKVVHAFHTTVASITEMAEWVQKEVEKQVHAFGKKN